MTAATSLHYLLGASTRNPQQPHPQGQKRSSNTAGALREHSSSDAKRPMRAFPVFEIATRACPLLLIQPMDSWRSSQPLRNSRYNGSKVSLARPKINAPQRPWIHNQLATTAACRAQSHYLFKLDSPTQILQDEQHCSVGKASASWGFSFQVQTVQSQLWRTAAQTLSLPHQPSCLQPALQPCSAHRNLAMAGSEAAHCTALSSTRDHHCYPGLQHPVGTIW